MPNIDRRAFMASSIGAAAAAAAPGAAGAATLGSLLSAATVRTVREEQRVVIIGSGFGGGVAALRLAQAGIPSMVLERGRRWVTGPNMDTFPTLKSLDERVLWYGSAKEVYGRRVSLIKPYAGLIDAIAGTNMTVMTAAGLGGGSLLYQGMTLQPSEAIFNACLPQALDYQKMDAIYYPRVAKMLQVATAPDELINSPNYTAARLFSKHVRAAGYAVEKIPMPIDWNFALAELRGEMKPSYTNGDCALGVNNGGKHSVDVTYIAAAERTGMVSVRVLHHVRKVARAANGQWQVHVDHTDVNGTVLEKKIITCKALIMAAGSVGTTKLLLRARAQNTISNLPDALGAGWGTNGDRIMVWTNLNEDFGAIQGGPVIYGSKEWADPQRANTVIQASIPPVGLDLRSTMLVGFGVSDKRGKWRYNPLTDESTLDWQREGDWALHQRILARAKQIAGSGSLLLDTHAIAPSTWHPLGGANMGTVCDLSGRVREQKGLYVLDGALIPGTTCACNPSMTIAAVAERAIDDIIANDVGALV